MRTRDNELRISARALGICRGKVRHDLLSDDPRNDDPTVVLLNEEDQ